MRELGVGITLLPHAMREFAALGLQGGLARAGVVIRGSCFFDRFGELIHRKERGHAYAEVSVSSWPLHVTLYRAALARLGAEAICTGQECVRVEQDDADADGSC
jgi:hypothetical protein